MRDATENNTRQDVPKQYFEFQRTEMLEFVPPSPQTFLELGCGAGAFGSYSLAFLH